MSITVNARGTSVPYFKIGKGGTTLYQGASDPSGSYTINNGDYWLDSTSQGLKIRNSGVWNPPALGSLTFPTGTGSLGQALVTDGSGNLSFASIGSGTVTSVSVTSTNGFAGSVATATTTPAITISTTVTGLLTGNGTAISAASGSNINTTFGSQTANYFYAAPDGSPGNPSFRAISTSDIPTLNQNTIGSAATLTTARNITATGDASWTVSFNGSTDVSAGITLATVNVSPQTDQFRKITVNGKGLVTASSAVSSGDITTALGYTPVNKAGDTMTGNLLLDQTVATDADIINANRSTSGTAQANIIVGNHPSTPTHYGGIGMDFVGTYQNEMWFYVNTGNPLVLGVDGGGEFLRFNTTMAMGLAGANYGTSGQIIRSAGSGSPPTWSSSFTGSSSDNVLKAGDTMTGNLNITETVNGDVGLIITNNSNGTIADSIILLTNDTAHSLAMAMFGSGYSGSPDSALIFTDSASTLFLGTNSAARITIDSTGNVAIGTNITSRTDLVNNTGAAATPRLQTLGTTINGTSTANVLYANSAIAPNFIFGKSRGTTVGAQAVVNNNDLLGSIIWNVSDGTVFGRGVEIIAKADAASSSGSTPGRLEFYTTPSASVTPSERMRIDSSGNVMIATTSPASGSILSVSGESYFNGNMTIDSSSNSGLVLAVQNTNSGASASAYLGVTDGTSAIFLAKYSTGHATRPNQTWIGTDTATALIFATTFAERARIETNGVFWVGSSTSVPGTTPIGIVSSSSSASGAGLIVRKAATATNTANIILAKANGSVTSPTAITSGDGAGGIFMAGYDGTNYITSATVESAVDTTVSTGIVPGRLLFKTQNTGGTLTERLRINSSGDILNVSVGGLGYGTGSGGTVTQATSRTTGVTLNKTNGAITLVSAAGTATYQSFTVTNSTVVTTDVIIVNQKSGTDKNIILVTAVAAGSFQITFATTGGTTTEQPIFNFAVIKAVTA